MAKINTNDIEGYENMTPEQKVAALEAYEYEDNTAEVNRLKGAASKANAEAAEWKRKHNALLGEEERKKAEDNEALAAMKQELESLKREKAVSEYKASFIGQGYPEELALETAKALASGDTSTLFANQKKFLDAHDKSMRADALKSTPRPPAGGSSGGVDYHKLAQEAQDRGDTVACAHYTRLAGQAEAETNM